MHNSSPRDWLLRRTSDDHAGAHVRHIETGAELSLNFSWPVHGQRKSRVRVLGIAHPAEELPARIGHRSQENDRAFGIEWLSVALNGATAGRGGDQGNGLENCGDRLIAVH